MTVRPPEELVTARLRLRRPVRADAPAMFETWTRDPEVTRYLIWRPHAELQEKAHIDPNVGPGSRDARCYSRIA